MTLRPMLPVTYVEAWKQLDKGDSEHMARKITEESGRGELLSATKLTWTAQEEKYESLHPDST